MQKNLLVLISSCLTAPLVYAQGGWVIDQTTQCRVWNSDPKPNQSMTWSGKCENGTAGGAGVASWHEGNKVVTSIKGGHERRSLSE